MYICICIYINISMFVYTYKYTYVRTHVNICLYTHLNVIANINAILQSRYRRKLMLQIMIHEYLDFPGFQSRTLWHNRSKLNSERFYLQHLLAG